MKDAILAEMKEEIAEMVDKVESVRTMNILHTLVGSFVETDRKKREGGAE